MSEQEGVLRRVGRGVGAPEQPLAEGEDARPVGVPQRGDGSGSPAPAARTSSGSPLGTRTAAHPTSRAGRHERRDERYSAHCGVSGAVTGARYLRMVIRRVTATTLPALSLALTRTVTLPECP